MALESGALPVCLNGNSIKWTKTLPGGGGALTPDRMSKEQYAELLPIIFEGEILMVLSTCIDYLCSEIQID